MTTDDIQKLGEAARQIAEIVKKHRADGEAIRKALEPLHRVLDPFALDPYSQCRPRRSDIEGWYPQRKPGPMLGWPCEPGELDSTDEPPKPYGMPPRCGQILTPRVARRMTRGRPWEV